MRRLCKSHGWDGVLSEQGKRDQPESYRQVTVDGYILGTVLFSLYQHLKFGLNRDMGLSDPFSSKQQQASLSQGQYCSENMTSSPNFSPFPHHSLHTSFHFTYFPRIITCSLKGVNKNASPPHSSPSRKEELFTSGKRRVSSRVSLTYQYTWSSDRLRELTGMNE